MIKYFVSYSFHAAVQGRTARTPEAYSQGFGNGFFELAEPFGGHDQLQDFGRQIVAELEQRHGYRDVAAVVLNFQPIAPAAAS